MYSKPLRSLFKSNLCFTVLIMAGVYPLLTMADSEFSTILELDSFDKITLPQDQSSDNFEFHTINNRHTLRIDPRMEGKRQALTLEMPIARSLDSNQTHVIRFRMRGVARDGQTVGQAGLILTLKSESEEPHQAAYRAILIVSDEWESFTLPFTMAKSYAESEAILSIATAYFDEIIEIEGFQWKEYGTTPLDRFEIQGRAYQGQEPDAEWRIEAAKRIDQYRKADLRVVITDRWNNPIPGLTIHIQQQSHAYPFGTAIVGSRVADSERKVENPEAQKQFNTDNIRYRKELKRNFNTIVFENDLKWPQWAGVRPDLYQQHWTMEALDWFRMNNIRAKGHNIIWGSWRFTPEWLREKEKKTELIQNAVLAHIRDVGSATADLTEWWDVLNEPMSHTDLIQLLGMDAVADWFKQARKVLPNSRLVMNEFDMIGNGGSPNRRARFIEFTKELINRGAPLDVIGFQAHFWSNRLTAPTEIWRIIDEFDQALGLPLMISEFDMNLPNDQIQADYTRDLLTAWFAHPSTEAFIMWGFWGGAHWMGDRGAMYKSDWTEKPNLAAYRNLVFDEWWTDEIFKSDDQGKVELRAFKGSQKIFIELADGNFLERKVDLCSNGRTVYIIIPE